MQLDSQKIKEITLGASRVEKDENGFNFYRFTERQEELYKNRRERGDVFYNLTFTTSGICLAFKTNSQSLFLSTSVLKSGKISYFAIDVFVNGEKIDSLNNFENVDCDKYCGYKPLSFPLGEFEKTFSLGQGTKEVRIYLPWAVRTIIKELCIDDGAFLEAVKPKYKMLSFGDSITQGYDALYPSNKYITRLARFLDAEEHNKAIGGEIHFPELVKEREDYTPDFITVAYGTNDWNRCSYELFLKNCQEFYKNLCESYPNTKIFTITPIWRKDIVNSRPFGDFKDVDKLIREVTAKFENITVITGFDFVDKSERLFADRRLHPNDAGFEQYFNSLSKQIRI